MRLFLLGATPAFERSAGMTPEAKLKATGGNAGNQVIAHGLLQSIRHSAAAWDYSIGPARVDAEYDMIVIAAANFLFPGFDFGGMAAFIEATKLPVAMVGLGAQSRTADDPEIALKQGTRRLLEVVADRSRSMGIRGEFTGRVLARLGFKDFTIVGCPSYYSAGPHGFTVRKPAAIAAEARIATHASRDVVQHSSDPARMAAVVRGLYQAAFHRKGIFVAQTEAEEIALAEAGDSETCLRALDRLAPAIGLERRDPEVVEWLGQAMRVYWSVPDWIDALAGLSFVVGTRFHGTMAGLLAGTPSLCICHDSRTTELCEFLGIPWISIRDLPEGRIDLARLFGIEGAYPALYRRRYADYAAFLTRNGLEAA